jgi:hypothetical protein
LSLRCFDAAIHGSPIILVSVPNSPSHLGSSSCPFSFLSLLLDLAFRNPQLSIAREMIDTLIQIQPEDGLRSQDGGASAVRALFSGTASLSLMIGAAAASLDRLLDAN